MIIARRMAAGASNNTASVRSLGSKYLTHQGVAFPSVVDRLSVLAVMAMSPVLRVWGMDAAADGRRVRPVDQRRMRERRDSMRSAPSSGVETPAITALTVVRMTSDTSL